MPKLGYLLPTRERVMENHHETGSLLALAERAEALGFDSIWVGDSVTARPVMHVAGVLRIDRYNGRESVRLQIDDAASAAGAVIA